MLKGTNAKCLSPLTFVFFCPSEHENWHVQKKKLRAASCNAAGFSNIL